MLLLLLALTPCCIIDNCPEERQATEKTATQHMPGDEDGCSSCSPLFACANCHVAVVWFAPDLALVPPIWCAAAPVVASGWPLVAGGELASFVGALFRPPAVC